MSVTTNNKKNISKHILPTSSNLLGLCFVILTFIKVLKLANETFIDELVAIAIIFFLVASFFSYASMRTNRWAEKYEKIADIMFLTGLLLLSVGSVIIAFEII